MIKKASTIVNVATIFENFTIPFLTIILCSFVFILYTLKIDANELFWGTDTHTSESQQLDNQIALYAKQLSIDKKHIVLNLMDDLKT